MLGNQDIVFYNLIACSWKYTYTKTHERAVRYISQVAHTIYSTRNQHPI